MAQPIKKAKGEVIAANEALHSEARQKFSDHVQAIAFNLTLSRRMIGLLQVARDGLMIWADGLNDKSPAALVRREHAKQLTVLAHGADNIIGLSSALQRRGLIYRPPILDEKNGSDYWGDSRKQGVPLYRLTRAGELVCDLLEEAGLMPAPAYRKSKRTA